MLSKSLKCCNNIDDKKRENVYGVTSREGKVYFSAAESVIREVGDSTLNRESTES